MKDRATRRVVRKIIARAIPEFAVFQGEEKLKNGRASYGESTVNRGFARFSRSSVPVLDITEKPMKGWVVVEPEGLGATSN